MYPGRCDFWDCRKALPKVPIVHWHMGFKTYYCGPECMFGADRLRGEYMPGFPYSAVG
jgi:hypothetical protein